MLRSSLSLSFRVAEPQFLMFALPENKMGIELKMFYNNWDSNPRPSISNFFHSQERSPLDESKSPQ